MSVDWGLEYLRGIFPPTGPEQSARAQATPEKPAVPATTSHVADPSEIQKSEAQVPAEPIADSPIINTVDSSDIAEEPDPDPIDLKHMMDLIVALLRKYLVCDDYQLTILTLWIVHTWCFEQFSSTAYLDIRSPQPESGKTRCLDLLGVLCQSPWRGRGPTPGTVIQTLLKDSSLAKLEKNLSAPSRTILLDDSHHVFGPSERQQLVAMLNSGARRDSWYTLGETSYSLFGPKAFAGNTPLPRSLGARCVPIILKRKKPPDVVDRFDYFLVIEEADAIIQQLQSLAKDDQWILEKLSEGPPKIPPVLTAHEQDCAEPLLYIAHAIGGPWPERARNAIIACSRLADCSPSVQVLADIRTSFLMNNNPDHLLTRDLLPMLRSMEHRPWAAWPNTSGSARRLAQLLEPYRIKPGNFTVGSERGIKGYRLIHFHDAWERYLNPISISEEAGAPDSHSSNSTPAQIVPPEISPEQAASGA
ncbi:MAG TPA: DUF3631 domain-containing protein [Candidatus Angelobacter sp.]